MTQTLTGLLNDCAVRLRAPGGSSGTGFFVAPGLVLTCAHVIKRKPADGETVTVRWRGKDYDGGLDRMAPDPCPEEGVYPDIALLRVAIDDHPSVLLKDGAEPGDTLYSKGYTSQRPTGEPVLGVAAGVAGFGEASDADKSLLKFTGDIIPHGLSGSPLLDLATGAVCGMVKRTRSPDNPLGGFAVRSAVILQHFPELQGLQDQYHELHPDWPAAAGVFSSEAAVRWRAWEEEQRDKVFQPRLEYHDSAVPSPLADAWEDFVGGRAWHEVIAEQLDTFEAAGEHPALHPLVAAAEEINCELNYREILKRLERLGLKRVLGTVKGIVQRLLRKQGQRGGGSFGSRGGGAEDVFTADDERLLQAAKDLQSAAWELNALAERPRFNRCFCVMGALGSGRTQFVASLLGRAGEEGRSRDYFLLPLLEPPADRDLEQWLLAPLRRATGVAWESLAECDAVLAARNERVVVVLDDLQAMLQARDKFEEDLRAFVEATTPLHSLYWLMTLHDTSYDLISMRASFWRMYGYQDDARHFHPPAESGGRAGRAVVGHNGWLMLNEFNRVERFGFEVLKALAGEQLAADLVAAEASMVRYLTPPFMAWVVEELNANIDIQNLVTLNFIGFVDRFWENRLGQVKPGSLTPADLRACVTRLAEHLVKQGRFAPEKAEVLRALSPDDPEFAKRALALLEEMSLLARDSEAPAPGDEWQAPERVQLQFEVFWHRHLAAQVRALWDQHRGDRDGFLGAVRTAFQSVGAEHVREGTWEFFLLLLDQAAKRDDAERAAARDLWLATLGDPTLPVQAVFFAGAKAGAETQHQLVAHLRDRQKAAPAAPSKRVLFSLMHFLSESEVVALPDRIELLRPHYPQIEEAGLTQYFLFLSRRLIARETTDEASLLAALPHFADSQVMGVAGELARFCWDRVLDLFFSDSEAVVEFSVSYLSGDGEIAEAEYRGLGRNKKPRGCYFFREWFLNSLCDWLLEKQGMRAYDVFAERMGYGSGEPAFPARVDAEAERETTLAFGRWYRKRAGRQRRESQDEVRFYRGLVERLFHGDGQAAPSYHQKKTAYFLIRHSGRVEEGTKALAVDRQFEGIIAEIRRDPNLAHLPKAYPIEFDD